MRLILSCFLLSLLSFSAHAQEYYTGAEYTRFSGFDGLQTYYGIEGEHRGAEIGTFVTTKEDDTRLRGLTLDGYIYTPSFSGLTGFATMGTAVMDIQKPLGNHMVMFPRVGAGVQYDLSDKWALRSMARYTEGWAYSVGIRRTF